MARRKEDFSAESDESDGIASTSNVKLYFDKYWFFLGNSLPKARSVRDENKWAEQSSVTAELLSSQV